MAKPWHDREFRASYAKAWRAKNPESQKAYSQKYIAKWKAKE